MKPLRDACVPRSEVLKSDLQDAIFAADFGHVIAGHAPEVYQDPGEFFRNTHPAAPLKKVVTTVFGRLADPNEVGAGLRLSTGYGGGKTHTLIALWHLANNISQSTLGTELLPAAGRPGTVAVAGVDGEKAGATVFGRHDDAETHSLWGELAYQLGGKAAYERVASIDTPETAPDSALIRGLLPNNKPVLILLDELVKYMAKLGEVGRKSLLAFIGALISETGARKNAVLVITDPAGQIAYQKESQELAQSANEAESGQWLDSELGRKLSDIDPIGNEAAQVIVRRLFESVDSSAAEAVSAEYYNAYKRMLEADSEVLPPDVASQAYAKRIVECYPFHPRLLETAQNRLGALQDFNKSRGTLRLFARIMRDIWDSQSEIPLIAAGDLDWSSDRIQADLLRRLNRDEFKPAVDADVVLHAGKLDHDFSTDIHRRVLSALLLESLPLTHNSAMDKREFALATLRPSDVGHEAEEAMNRLYAVCWHTYKDETGAKFQFRYEPNVNKLIEERSQTVPVEDARQQVLARAQAYLGGHNFELIPYPTSPKSVSDTNKLKLVLADGEAKAQAVCDCQDDSDPSVPVQRRFRNAIFGIAPSKGLLDDAVQLNRQLIAAREIKKEQQNNRTVRDQVEEAIPILSRRAGIRAVRAFNRVVFQGRQSLTLPEKFLVSEDAMEGVNGNGQNRLMDFLGEQKLIYQPGDAIDADLLLDYVMKGATPSVDHEGAYTASGVHERALASDKLRLMLTNEPVRKALSKAIEQGKLVVRLANGDAYDKDGYVTGMNGERQRRQGSNPNISLHSDVLVALVDAPCVSAWTDTGNPKAEEAETDGAKSNGWVPSSSAYTWDDAISLSKTRPMRSLDLTVKNIEAARSLAAIAQRFGAKSLTQTVRAGGDLRDGGKMQFLANEVKINTPIKPLDVIAPILRAMSEGANFQASVRMDFGDGLLGADAKLKQAQDQSGGEIGIDAQFGDEVEQ